MERRRSRFISVVATSSTQVSKVIAVHIMGMDCYSTDLFEGKEEEFVGERGLWMWSRNNGLGQKI